MVSLWPFAARDSSPASFEKALSTLAKKITETQAKLERMRVKSRKAKVIGTLYLTFAYLVYAIVLLLVVGYKNLGPYEWTGMAGGPVVIYTARQITMSYYNLVMDSLEARLTEHQDERSKTIQKLKDATRYDSTMELIEKYGGPEGRPKSRGQDSSHDGGDSRAPSAHGTPGRTHIPPPATANIQRREAQGSRPSTPQAFPAPGRPRNDSPQPSAEFAPNAFGPGGPIVNNNGHPQQQQQQQPPQIYVTGPPESHWYDRIFDVLLGEDETAAKNRIVLICRACRLVNGQAPPGTKTLAELGTWRCMACGAPNGEMDEGKRIVREVLTTGGGTAATAAQTKADGDNGDRDRDRDDDDDEEEEEEEEEDKTSSTTSAATGTAALGAKAKAKSKSKSMSKSRGKSSDEDTPNSAAS
ncbi:Protein lunapark [Escovopsis weberi]|uniref:Endoplasmic reticulum junction formation protein lunapark n=1 Tax=Escovopsis weberi TaxID=150374 RepID=A0A0M9VU91_ESCWE|nr:Protein lunapark [Escovopsis weberi]